VYPLYFKAAITEGENWPDHEEVPQGKVAATLRSMNEALIKERTRQWGSNEPQISDDPEAAHLQKVGHDIPKAVAERVVKEHRVGVAHNTPQNGETDFFFSLLISVF
jgi:hypothetical protein